MLYKPDEAARLLGIGRSKVYELLAADELESVKVGSARRIPAAALEEFVARLRDESREPQPAA
jgi:excisionase family DNA binding protein